MGKHKPKRKPVEVVHPAYQPRRAELRKDLRLNATFEETVAALVRPVRVRYVASPRKKPCPGGLGSSRT